ncbi:MAG: hypothetical protein HYW22_02425 [Candidatus Aenigmarchaeota archaeon]|nr:hypothetical protein [Candidatus Aenigmarchaeota archaeon]
MKIKISATYEGKCSICKKKSIVFTAGDEDTHRTVSICKDCAAELGDADTASVIEKHGKVDKEPFKEGVKITGKGTAG